MVGGRVYRVYQPETADALIDEAEFDHDERLPYWADLWPSSIALARHVAEMDLAAKKVVEVGCGVALPAMPALANGAEVTVTDGPPFSRLSSRSKGAMSPKVALISKKRARGMVSRGICQATPRSRSP